MNNAGHICDKCRNKLYNPLRLPDVVLHFEYKFMNGLSHFDSDKPCYSPTCGLGGLVLRVLEFQAGYCGFESRSGRDNF